MNPRGRSKLFSRKAQAAAAAAILVAIIGAALISYVILVTPDERAALLDGDINDDSDDTNRFSEILLEEYPGKIEYIGDDEIEHSLASVHIYSDSEAQTFTQRNSLFAKKSVFSSKNAYLYFEIEKIKLVDDLKLSFRVIDSSGKLTVFLNEEIVLEKSFSSQESVTLDLPASLLKNQNQITFSASSPGAAFWKSNEINIESLIVVGNVVDVTTREATGVFSISDTEYENMESVDFSFQPDCAKGTKGLLTITLNNVHTLYSGTPDCDVQMGDIELDPSMLFAGQNTIHFATDEGNYVLYNVKVETKLEEVEYPTYYFQLTYEEEQRVSNNDQVVEVTLSFVDEEESKNGYVSINGYKRYFDSTSSEYSFDISDYVTGGNNAISIRPSKTLEIRELLVELD